MQVLTRTEVGMLVWKRLTGIALLFLLIAFAAFGIAPASAQAPVATTTTTTTAVNSNTVVTATATLTPTATSVPATATNTVVPPTATTTKTVAPTATKTAVPPSTTATLVPATATQTQVPPTATVTKTVAPSATATKPAATATVTKTATVAPTKTNTPVPPTATVTRAAAPRAGVVSSLSTAFTVQNTDASTTANLTATFYDTSGAAVSTVNKTILPYLSTTVDQRASGGGLDSFTSWQGSVVLSSNTQLAAVVNQYSGNVGSLGIDFRADSYTGVASTDASTTVLMPQLLKGIYDAKQNTTYNSTIAIQNTNATVAASVTITYYNQAIPGTYTRSGITIQPNSSVFIDMQNEPSLSGVNYFYGPGSLSSSQPVAVIVNQNAGGVLTVYPGFTNASAATTLYAPQLLKNVYDIQQQVNWGTGIMVMTANQSSADVTITYTNQQNGRVIVETKTANPAATFDQRYLVSETSFYGSAILTSSTPIIAITNMVTDFSPSRGVRASTYRAITTATGTQKVFIPLILKNYYDPGTGVTWGTGIAVRLLSSSSGTVWINYYNGGTLVGTSSSLISPSSPMVTFDQRFDPTLAGQSVVNGSAVITSTVPIAATVNGVGSNTAIGDAASTYAGVNQ